MSLDELYPKEGVRNNIEINVNRHSNDFPLDETKKIFCEPYYAPKNSEMKQVINQFDAESKSIYQLHKDLDLLKKHHAVISSHTFYDRIAKKHTSVIFYYE